MDPIAWLTALSRGWFAVIGLGFDMAGAVALALGAWMPVRTGNRFDDIGTEPPVDRRRRRNLVIVGVCAMVFGFALQIVANIPRSAVATLGLGLAATSASAAEPGDTITGTGVPLDGDTVRFVEILTDDGRPLDVRLWALDAPEMDNLPWGPYARAKLDKLVIGKALSCDVVGQSGDRPVGVCTTEAGGDIAKAMLRAGWATVQRAYLMRPSVPSNRREAYLAAEETALRERRGLWRDWPDGP